MMQRLKCLLGFHDEHVSYAKGRTDGEYTRQYADGRESESIDGCTIVFECEHCGSEDGITAPASVADRRDLWRE